MKGIILAGGTGSRLWPVTKVVSKQLLPVYDKPMIYYPISTLMLAEIQDILIITSPNDAALFQRLLGDGSQWGLRFNFLEQQNPEGIAQALSLAEDFLNGEFATLILGDNIFIGSGVGATLKEKTQILNGCKIFPYKVADPREFGVLELDAFNQPIRILEKPVVTNSDRAIPGLYVFDGSAPSRVKRQIKSTRGEYEITDLLTSYLNDNLLQFEDLERGSVWLDMGNPVDLSHASEYVRLVEQRQRFKIACPEEIAWRNSWIGNAELRVLANQLLPSGYGKYLLGLLT